MSNTGVVHSVWQPTLSRRGLVERYQDNMVKPTFSLASGFCQPEKFLVILREIPRVDLTARSIVLALYAFRRLHTRTFRLHPRLTLNAGCATRRLDAWDLYGRDSALPSLTDRAPTVGPLYENPTRKNLSPRVGFAWTFR